MSFHPSTILLRALFRSESKCQHFWRFIVLDLRLTQYFHLPTDVCWLFPKFFTTIINLIAKSVRPEEQKVSKVGVPLSPYARSSVIELTIICAMLKRLVECHYAFLLYLLFCFHEAHLFHSCSLCRVWKLYKCSHSTQHSYTVGIHCYLHYLFASACASATGPPELVPSF